MWRYDHVGNIVEFPDGTTTCGNGGGYTHRLFAADFPVRIDDSLEPGEIAVSVPHVEYRPQRPRGSTP